VLSDWSPEANVTFDEECKDFRGTCFIHPHDEKKKVVVSSSLQTFVPLYRTIQGLGDQVGSSGWCSCPEGNMFESLP